MLPDLGVVRYVIKGDERHPLIPDAMAKARVLLGQTQAVNVPRLNFEGEGYKVEVIRTEDGQRVAIIQVEATQTKTTICPTIASGLLWLALKFDGCRYNGWYWDSAEGFKTFYGEHGEKIAALYKCRKHTLSPTGIPITQFIMPSLMAHPYFSTGDGGDCAGFLAPMDNTLFTKSPAMYSGLMRGAMQLLAGMGVELDYEFVADRSHGCFIVGGRPWVVEIGSRGILAAPMPICLQDMKYGRDPALRNKLFPFHPSPYSNPFRQTISPAHGAPWKTLLSAGDFQRSLQVNGLTYQAFFRGFGWAFAYKSLQAAHCLMVVEPNTPGWILTTLATIKFQTAQNELVSAQVKLTPPVYFNQALGNFKFPLHTPGVYPWGIYLNSVGPRNLLRYPPRREEANPYLHCYFTQDKDRLELLQHNIGSMKVENITETAPGCLDANITSTTVALWATIPVGKARIGSREIWKTQTGFYITSVPGEGEVFTGTAYQYDIPCGAVDTKITHPGGAFCAYGCGWIQTTGSCMGTAAHDAVHTQKKNLLLGSTAAILWGDREHVVIAEAYENSYSHRTRTLWTVSAHVMVIEPEPASVQYFGCPNPPPSTIYCISGSGFWGALWAMADSASNDAVACSKTSEIPPYQYLVPVTGGYDKPARKVTQEIPAERKVRETVMLYNSTPSLNTILDRTVVTHPGENIDPIDPPYTMEDRIWDSYASLACPPDLIGFGSCTYAHVNYGFYYKNTLAKGGYVPQHLFNMNVPYVAAPTDSYNNLFTADPPVRRDNVVYVGYKPDWA